MVKLFGKYLLLGSTTPQSVEITNELLEREITTAKEMTVVDVWFIELIEEMICKNASETPSFKDVRDTLEAHMKERGK